MNPIHSDPLLAGRMIASSFFAAPLPTDASAVTTTCTIASRVAAAGICALRRAASWLLYGIGFAVAAHAGNIFVTDASAASISLQGTLALSAGAANDTAAYTFFVSAASTVTIQSYGYGGSGSAPGGTNLAGTVILAGGFDPYISIFTGAGPVATFLASNDDGHCPPGTSSAGLCGDSTLSLILGPGTYTLVVEAFENMSLAENLGSGTLGDGFTGLGNFDPLRTNNFAIDISGPFVDTIFANGFE